MEENKNETSKKLDLNELWSKIKRDRNNGEAVKKSRFSPTWKALTIFIAILILYTIYHVSVGLTETLKTTPTGLVEQSTSIVLEGVIFRDEKPIPTKNKGDIRPYYYDGERVAVDSIVAAVYTKGGNSDVNDKIAELEKSLDILKRSNVKGLLSIVDIEKIQKNIDALYTNMMLAIASGDSLRAVRAEEELLINMNKLKIHRGEVKNYNDEIAKIESELDSLYNSFKGDKEYISADQGGYFYHSCDGYEERLTPEALSTLTPDTLGKLIGETKKNPIVKSDYRCKFVYSNVWRMAVLCDDEEVALLEEGRSYNVVLFDVRERELSFTLEKIGRSEGGKSVLTFTCLDMPEDFDFTRYQSFRLDVSSIEGYRVPKEALVQKKINNERVNGVYILDASIVKYKRIDIIGETDGYYIVAKLDKSKENYVEYLNLNDIIILETSGLYEGQKLTR